MSYIVIAKLISANSATLYTIVDEKTLTKANVTEKRILTTNVIGTNFRKSTNGKKIIGGSGSYKPTIIRDGNVVEEYKTLISVDKSKDEVVLMKYTGELETITIEEYKIARKNKLNNEFVIKRDGISHINLVRYGGESGDVLEIARDIEVDNNSIKTEQYEINECTKQQSKEATENDDNTSNIKRVIFNMFPTDRLTISIEEYNEFESVIVRILDSNMSNTLSLALCKLYKSEDKSRFTLAYVKTDTEQDRVTVQVIGQSDIDEKLITDGIEKLCQTYAVWIKESKFTKI